MNDKSTTINENRFEGVLIAPSFPLADADVQAVPWRDYLYKGGIIGAGMFFLFLLVLLKSKTTIDFDMQPYLFSYSIFVTVFILSRIISAMLSESSAKSLAAEGLAQNAYKNDYEPPVTFIIPCKNEEKDIIDTITQCYRVLYPKEKVEVIVIDDGSTDNTFNVLKKIQEEYPSLRIIHWEKNRGKREAMAEGFRVSNGEIVIQLDSDSYIEPETFREIIEPFRNPKVGAVCANGEPKNADQNVITRMQTAYYFMSFRILKAAESTYATVFCCSGCCSAYRKKAVMPVIGNWLHEKFLGLPVTWGDDRALTSWLLRNDWKTVFNSNARAYTIVPDKWKKLFVQQLRWKKSWIVNFFFTSRFIFKKQPFVAFLYYLPLIAISFLTPIMTFRALIYMPLVKGVFPIYHIIGIFLITAILALYYRYLDRENVFWPYLFLWSFLNLFALSFVIVWAAVRIQDRGWGTR